jgi:hypothetical protein
LRKPGGDARDEPLLNLMFGGSDEEHKKLRQLYAHAAHFLEARRQANRLKAKVGKPVGQGGQGKAKAEEEDSRGS